MTSKFTRVCVCARVQAPARQTAPIARTLDAPYRSEGRPFPATSRPATPTPSPLDAHPGSGQLRLDTPRAGPAERGLGFSSYGLGSEGVGCRVYARLRLDTPRAGPAVRGRLTDAPPPAASPAPAAWPLDAPPAPAPCTVPVWMAAVRRWRAALSIVL